MERLRSYVVYACPKCHLAQMSRCDRKTRKCFGCGSTLRLDWSRIPVLYSTDSAREAIEVVKKLKAGRDSSGSSGAFVRSSLLKRE